MPSAAIGSVCDQLLWEFCKRLNSDIFFVLILGGAEFPDKSGVKTIQLSPRATNITPTIMFRGGTRVGK
jgi:hypothetical protein